MSAAAQTSDLTASNVPGVPLWLAGARVERMYPLVATVGAAVLAGDPLLRRRRATTDRG